ncbi:hypothetical protein PMAYCL1PPCAC_01040, partial [Pristionchus mayeri]
PFQSTKQHNTNGPKKKKKSWSLEGKNKKTQPKGRQQIKAMLLAKEKIKEEDLDAPPNSDAKDDSFRIFEQHKYTAEKEEYVTKQPQIALKRQVKKKGNRRAETVRVVCKNRSRNETPKLSREESASATNIDTSLFKERFNFQASANNSNANTPDNSERQREREESTVIFSQQIRQREQERQRDMEDRTQQDRSIMDKLAAPESEGDSSPLPLAREPEPEIEKSRRPTVVQRTAIEKSAPSRMTKTASGTPQQKVIDKELPLPTPYHASTTKSTGETSSASTQLALVGSSIAYSYRNPCPSPQEPEPDLDRVRRQKEAAFMKRFLTALKLLPNTVPPRPVTPVPRSEDSPSDSSKGRGNFKHHPPQNQRKHPK